MCERKRAMPILVKYMEMNRENALRLAAEERWENMIEKRSRKNTHGRRERK